RPVLRREAVDYRQVVDVGGHPQARVEAVRGALEPFREQKGPRVDGRRQMMLALPGRPPVQEGQLGQGEELVEIASGRDHPPMQVGKNSLGALLELREQTGFAEHVACGPAGLPRGDGAAVQLAVDGLRVDADRADRRRARRRQESHEDQTAHGQEALPGGSSAASCRSRTSRWGNGNDIPAARTAAYTRTANSVWIMVQRSM